MTVLVGRVAAVAEANGDTAYCLNKLMAEKHLLLAVRAGHVRGTCLRLAASVYGSNRQVGLAADRKNDPVLLS